MQRRNFFQTLFGVAATTACATIHAKAPAAIATESVHGDDEKPLALLQPVCPKCGSYCMYCMIDNTLKQEPGTIYRIVCQCGWIGKAPMAVKVSV